LDVVGVIRTVELGGRAVEPGARLLGRQTGDGWVVLMNGREVLVPAGSVDVPESRAFRAVEERLSARDEEYSVAPSGSG